MLYEGFPDLVDLIVANMPAEVQPIIRQLSTAAYAARALELYGATLPPQSHELAAAELRRPSRARTDDGFRGRLTIHELGGGISVTNSRIAPLTIASGAHREYDYLVFRLQVTGKGLLRQRDRQTVLAPGSDARQSIC